MSIAESRSAIYPLILILIILQPKRDLLPDIAFTAFEKSYQEPNQEEGFQELRRVNWVFEGSEEERQRWNMWLAVDGK